LATISNTPRPGYVWDSADNVWYPIGVGAHQHTNAADTPAVMPYSTYAAAGKNKIINGDFGIWQRGTTFNSIANFGYAADRTRISYDGSGTHNVTQQTFTPGAAPVSGYEGKTFFRFTQATAGSGASYNRWTFVLEDVQTLAGQTATLSFWAKAGSAQTITTSLAQNFGTGGSGEIETSAISHSLTTSWQRFTTTISVPSISGKTVGTSNSLIVYFKMPLNVAESYDFWGVQLEAGSTATDFQTATCNLASELAACQRYFQKSYDQSVAPGTASADSGSVVAYFAANVGNGSPFAWTKLHQTMRTVPTLTIYAFGGGTTRVSDNNNTDLAANSGTVTRTGEGGFGLYNNSGGTIAPGNNGFRFQWTGSAEL
jgi:hypothetical protein